MPGSKYREVHPKQSHRSAKLLIVPQEGLGFDSWRSGTRNFYYEAWRTAADLMGSDNVSVFHVDRGEDSRSWIPRLLDEVQDLGVTHILCHIESDPGSESTSWSWDLAWAELLRTWDGVLLGVMFDSAYRWLTVRSRRLARMSSRFMLVDICMPMDGALVSGRPEVGPVNMPLSRVSLNLLQDRLGDSQQSWDVTFIGALYPYRIELLEAVKSQGIRVAVNPHHTSDARDYESARLDQPEWLDYMSALSKSRLTLNFAKSNAADVYQLKTRVLEAMIAGTVLVTDDNDRTERFFRPGVDYLQFTGVEDLPAVIDEALKDPAALTVMAQRARERAEGLALRGFWEAIEAGLQRRQLPSLPAFRC